MKTGSAVQNLQLLSSFEFEIVVLKFAFYVIFNIDVNMDINGIVKIVLYNIVNINIKNTTKLIHITGQKTNLWLWRYYLWSSPQCIVSPEITVYSMQCLFSYYWRNTRFIKGETLPRTRFRILTTTSLVQETM